MVTQTQTVIDTYPLDQQTQQAVFTATEHVYSTLTEQGLPAEEVHRLSVCYRASALLVDSLKEAGLNARHEISTSPTVSEHSYVKLATNGGEVIVDPTWQQFLPKSQKDREVPKVLIGKSNDVVAKVRSLGIDEATARIWKDGPKMTPEQQQQVDLTASAQADIAVRNGAWEKFMTQPR